MKQAERMNEIAFSGIRRIAEKADALRSRGKDIIDLSIGRPDFDTPVNIKEAAKRALDSGYVHYTVNAGIIQLRQAISTYLTSEKGINCSPDEVIVTCGAAEAIALPLIAYLNPGDEVIIPNPTFVYYMSAARVAGAVPRLVNLSENNRFLMTPEQLEAAITPRSKMLILVNPSNPIGIMYNSEELKALAEIAVKHNLLVLCDEVYERIIYEAKHTSMASLPNMHERTFTINAFSKTYSMTGWRLGYLVSSKELISPMLKLHQSLVTCANSIAQWAGVEALKGPQDFVKKMVDEFTVRKIIVQDALKSVPGITCVEPNGAFYAFPNISAFGMTDEEMVEFLLEEGGVALVPGTTFGPAGKGYVRISFGSSTESIREAMNRIVGVLKKKKAH